MLYPSAEKLTSNHQSRYSLVIATAKVARKIASEAEANGIILMEKPVKTAVNKIASGEIVYREQGDDYVEAPKFNVAYARAAISSSLDEEDGDNSEE